MPTDSITCTLILRPEFQRVFRWSDAQKSRLIESVLLGIPLPSIFASQKNDGRWEVIDGLQRLSTLFETAGELRKTVVPKPLIRKSAMPFC